MSALQKVKAVKDLSNNKSAAAAANMPMLPGLGAKGSSFTPSIKDKFKKRKR
jgi:hypothetical protein